jgi:HEAT repeat protein
MSLPKRFSLLLSVLAPLLVLAALGGCGKKKSTDEMVEDLKGGRETDRLVAARTLPVGSGDAAKVIPALIGALKDKAPDVRASSAIKLGSFGDQAKDAVPALEAALSDRDVRVREAAGVALSRIDPARFTAPSKSTKGK